MIASVGNNSARNEILASIRGHLAASAPFDAVREEHHGSHRNLEEEVFAPVTATTTLTGTELVEIFRENLEAVDGKCRVVKSPAEALEAVREIIEIEKPGRATVRAAVSDSFLLKTIKDKLPGEMEILESASKDELFGCDIGITGAQWGIAETGTLVLESNEERNRLASLVPPVHIAVVEAKNIRQRMSEILALISEGERSGDQSRAVTFITGPSRTSDIELTLAIGVHGPRELHVIIVSD